MALKVRVEFEAPFGQRVPETSRGLPKKESDPVSITCRGMNGIGSSRTTNPTVKDMGDFGSVGGTVLRPQLISVDKRRATRKMRWAVFGTGRAAGVMVIPSPSLSSLVCRRTCGHGQPFAIRRLRNICFPFTCSRNPMFGQINRDQ
jgi:hypothetical protein